MQSPHTCIMATINQLIVRIEERLALAAGLNVQIHAENRLIETLRSSYNILFDDFWWPEYTKSATYTLDGTTGQITTDVTNIIRRYADIQYVYYDQDEHPLPHLQRTTNPARIKTRCITPSGDPETVFKVYPVDTTGNVHVWYRTRIADSVWEDSEFDTEINMDDELLIYSVCYDFMVDDASNDMAAQKFLQKLNARLKQLRAQQYLSPISKRQQEYAATVDQWLPEDV